MKYQSVSMHEIQKRRISQLEHHVAQQQQQFDSLHILYVQSVERETVLVREIQELRKDYRQQQLTLKLTQRKLAEPQSDMTLHGQPQGQLQQQPQKQLQEESECPDGPFDELEAQYNRELQSLRKLIILKGYKEESQDSQLKAQYEAKMQAIVAQYSAMQSEMNVLRSTILNNANSPPHSPPHSPTHSQLWEQVHALSHQLALREAQNERLLVLYEARMDSKEEYINLLRLKIENQELSSHDASIYLRY